MELDCWTNWTPAWNFGHTRYMWPGKYVASLAPFCCLGVGVTRIKILSGVMQVLWVTGARELKGIIIMKCSEVWRKEVRTWGGTGDGRRDGIGQWSWTAESYVSDPAKNLLFQHTVEACGEVTVVRGVKKISYQRLLGFLCLLGFTWLYCAALISFSFLKILISHM